MTIVSLVTFVQSLGGRVAVASLAIAALLGFRAYDVHHQRSVGAQQEQARVEAKGKKIATQAEAAKAKAEAKPDETLKRYYRD